ncbi:MAG: hypothetical protein ACR2PA_18420 [Hyphomicrobiaceae bacterium]
MRQQFARNDMRFSAEHMEAIRRQFNDAQHYAGNKSSAVDGDKKKNIKLLLRAWGRVIERPFRDLAKEIELLLPDWRAVSASFVLCTGLVMIIGIYLLPYQ